MYAVNVPSVGGDTLFTNCYAAYDALPKALKQKLAGRSATHIYGGRLKRQQDRLEDSERNRAPAVHPLVPTHPESGRKSLYFSDGQILNIRGLDQAESDTVIADLVQRTVSENGDCRHQWQRGDVVIWDNRCSIHCATGNYPANERRTNWRSTMMEFGWRRRLSGGLHYTIACCRIPDTKRSGLALRLGLLVYTAIVKFGVSSIKFGTTRKVCVLGTPV